MCTVVSSYEQRANAATVQHISLRSALKKASTNFLSKIMTNIEKILSLAIQQ